MLPQFFYSQSLKMLYHITGGRLGSVSAPVQGRGGLPPTTPNHPPAFSGFLLKGAISGFSVPLISLVLSYRGYLNSGGCVMCNTYERRYYTPQFSPLASVSVRRLAWAINKPMTETMDVIIKLIPSIVDPSKVCLSCKDSTKCQGCSFRSQLTAQEQGALLATL